MLPGGIALTWPATRFRVSLFQLEDSDLAERLRASHSVGHSRNPALKSRIPFESDVAVSVSPLSDCHPRVEACVSGFTSIFLVCVVSEEQIKRSTEPDTHLA